MIEGFGCRETEKIFNRYFSKSIPFDIQKRAKAKLDMIQAASDLMDVKNPSSNHLEKLRGDRSGGYSIHINDQWRICFFWGHGKAKNVKIEELLLI